MIFAGWAMFVWVWGFSGLVGFGVLGGFCPGSSLIAVV